jgi:hypothetical protein
MSNIIENPEPAQDLSTFVGTHFIYTYANGSDRDHLQKPAQPVASIFHLDLVYETNGHITDIVCHSEYQTQGIHDTSRTGGADPRQAMRHCATTAQKSRFPAPTRQVALQTQRVREKSHEGSSSDSSSARHCRSGDGPGCGDIHL